MKKVLIVDDEDDMLWMLQRNLDNGIPNIETFTAQSGEEALSVLNTTEINLVITDINMPGISGLELLTEVSNRFPSTKVIIMTAYPSNAFENTAKKHGAINFIEKPFDINELRKIVENVLTSEDSDDSMGGIALLDIIRFNGLAGATSALKVKKDDREGVVFFREGLVAHATLGSKQGEDAFFDIIEINGAELQNMTGVEPPVVSMRQSVDSLLLEAAVRKDEEAKIVDSALSSAEHPPEGTAALLPVEEKKSATVKTLSKPDIIEDEPENTEDDDMTEIQKILAEFTSIDGVHTACLVGRDGFLLDSIARSGIDAEMIGAIASSGFGSAETMGNQLGQGELTMTMLEYKEGPVMFAPVGGEAFLVIVADKDTNLGWIRIAIKKNSIKIEQIASI